jgi:hypothetical protein
MMRKIFQEEFAYHMVSRGRRFVLLRGLYIYGPVWFVGMGALFYFLHLHDPDPMRGTFLAYFLLLWLVLSEAFGLLVAFLSWHRYLRLAKGWRA